VAEHETDTGLDGADPAPEDCLESLVNAEFDSAEATDTAGEATDTTARKEDEGKQETTDTGKQKPERLYADKYRTVEELEVGYAEAVRKMHEATAAAAEKKKADDAAADDEWVTLNAEELRELQKNDAEAYEEYVYESLRRKREAKAKAGTEVEDRVNKIVDERLKPVDEIVREAEMRKWQAQEDQAHEATKTYFGKEYEALDKQRRDVKFIEKVLDEVPEVARVILGLQTGRDPVTGHPHPFSQASAHKLLLREIQIFNSRQKQDKAARSIPADTGRAAPPKAGKANHGKSIEDAFDIAFQELNGK